MRPSHPTTNCSNSSRPPTAAPEMPGGSKIKVLDDHTINKMAAGEVVENPVSVVKELVENALDAGATEICVELQEGGRGLIRVSDNGCGMSQDDALLCLERHATSKIHALEDIQGIGTMGFRGEAIPSIAAISRFMLLTASSEAEQGALLFVEGGRLRSCSPAARAPGTTVEVRSLFFNVPVRRQFQKSPSYDRQAILRLMGLFALAHPNVAFELISDQKTTLKVPVEPRDLPFLYALKRRMQGVWGESYPSLFLPLDFRQDPYRLEGFIGRAEHHKPARTGQHLFINRRLVFSPLISTAVREGYSTMLPSGRHPPFLLHLSLPGNALDVNVHPQKKEVRLRQEKSLRETLIQAVHTALEQEEACRQAPATWRSESLAAPSPRADPNQLQDSDSDLARAPKGDHLETDSYRKMDPFPTVESREFSFNPKTHSSAHLGIKEEPWVFSPGSAADLPLAPPPPEDFGNIFSRDASRPARVPRVLATLMGHCVLDPFELSPRLFGEIADRKEGGLALLNQRAAYSRIYYERLLHRSPDAESQLLLIPVTLSLTPSEHHSLREHLSLFEKMGFEIREFGKDSFVVDAFPAFLHEEQLQNCIHLLIRDLSEMHTSRRLQMQRQERLALTACRASLPPNRRLSLEEAEGLIAQLLSCKVPMRCPTGKPTCVYLSSNELTKLYSIYK